MGNKSVKKQNKLLDEQRELTTGYGRRAEGIAGEERARNRGLENLIQSGVGSLWGDAGNQQFVSPGSGSFHNPYMSESMPFYKKAMDTGLFDEGQINDYRARAGLQNSALFQALRRQLDQGANVRGGGFAGYSGQRALLSRDTARQAEEARLGAETSLQDMIRRNMFSGAQGVTGNDLAYQSALRDVDAQRNQFGLASAGMENQFNQNQFGNRAGLLGILGGLRGNDLGYANLAGNQYSQGLNAINSRQQETPWWQQALGAAGTVAGVALPFLGGGFGGGRQQQQVRQLPTGNYNQYDFSQMMR